ncbi:MAG: murein biosynthesis integral membrane protein MurJ [Lentisphaerae bacterium RIFOXYB12_FULL_65_16]|nr:MAG: murein biosynthesis integral membrane protein MurJ [Lentisphaerae bacterium RIFOXYA12_64_32]OGV90102.1 MAG: murein biosynthesis integral membrane protein MurJ [Lentisphaerae bacterium RIFOXYB12_FULL_65_16]
MAVGFGIFCSRIAGLVRDRVFAHYLGNSDAADAFRAAFRIPNLLQNLFGEGSLSAAFIPAYAKLRAEGNESEAREVAAGVAATLGLITAVLVAVGVVAAPVLVAVIAPGFSGEKRDLTVQLVRILFPGAGLLVGSAWCLGILNSHRRFLIPYLAPVFWNLIIIVALLVWGPRVGQASLAAVCAWASVAGSALQFGVQLPAALRLAGTLRPAFNWTLASMRKLLTNFVPALFGRGVAQVSAFVDEILASLLPTGAVAAFSYAQTLYVLPVSLFGMAVSASELPEMSSMVGGKTEVAAKLAARLNGGLHRIAFYVVPSAMAFLVLGDVVVGAIYQTGQFRRGDVLYVWGALAGSAVGLLAATMGRLYASAFYALHDTRTPLRFAILRLSLTAALGGVAALLLPGWLGIAPRWGVAGLTASAGVAAWVEFALLRRALNREIGNTGVSAWVVARLWLAAGLAAAAGFGVKVLLPAWHPIPLAVAVLGTYGVGYFVLTFAFGIDESLQTLRQVLRRLTGRRGNKAG